MVEAYLVYYLLLLLLFATWKLAGVGVWVGRPISLRNSEQVLLAIASVALYGLVLGLRYNVGGDYQGYVGYYENTNPNLGPGDVPFEIGFYWLIRALKLFELPPASLFLVTCTAQMLFMSLWLRKHVSAAPWFVYFFFTTLLLFEAMNTIRQATAFTILLYAVPYLLQRKLVPYAVLVALAASLHTSALLFLPLYFLLHRKWIASRRYQVIALLIAYASASAVKDLLFDWLPLLSIAFNYENYSGIQEDLFFEREATGFSPGLMFILVTDLLIVMASPWLKRKYTAVGFQAYYNAFYIGAILTPAVVFANYIPFARLAYYFTAFKFVVLGFLVTWLFSRTNPVRHSKSLGVALVLAYFGWFSLAISKQAAWCAPFQFVFQ